MLPLSRLYGAAALARRHRYVTGRRSPQHLPVPVISVGNITAGGTGKTPMAVYLAQRLKKRGRSPMIVSRGYRGSATKIGGIVSDGRSILMRADQAGDEPFLMSQLLPDVPVVVGRRRFEIAAAAIEKLSPDVIILDDGFQHFQLARDLDLVLLDHASPLDNHHLLPAGMLREPVDCLKYADAFVFTRADNPIVDAYPPALEGFLADMPVFKARHQSYLLGVVEGGQPLAVNENTAAVLPDHERVFVFSGLAKNKAFLASVQALTDKIAGHAFFADHHNYSAADLAALDRQAKDLGADLIVTTQKDYVKIAGLPGFTQRLAVLGAKMIFDDDAGRLDRMILSCLEKFSG